MWEQPGHQFNHKWAILIDPRDQFHGIKGYLKCNVQILTDGINEVQPTISNNEIEGNLLMPHQAHGRQQAIYTITVYRADDISFSKLKFGKEHEIECKGLYVKVSFAGKTLKTTRAQEGQEWNEALNFIEAIPSLFQTITVELWDQKTGNFVGSSGLSLKSLWLGNLPTFGPAFLYLFHSKTGQATGRILISLTCNLIDRSYPGKLIPIEKVFPFDETIFPPIETYTGVFVIFQSVFFKKKYSEKCLITLKHGVDNKEDENECNDEIILQNTLVSDLSWFLGITHKNIPILETSSNWPASDYRERRNNQIKNCTREIIEMIKQHHRGNHKQKLSELLVQVGKYCDRMLRTNPNNYENDLDKARKHALAQTIQKTKLEIEQFKNQDNLHLLERLEKNINTILELSNEPQPSFPDLEITLSKPSSKKRAKTFIKPEEHLYSPNNEESGHYSGKLSQFFINDTKGKDIAVLDGILWFGQQTHHSNFLNWVDTEIGNGLIYFQLRVHIYQGTIRPGSDVSGLADPFIRILAFGQTRETQVKAQTLDPFWDETLLFSKTSFYVKPEFFKTQSIGVIFMVFDYDGKGSVELIGRGVVYPKLNFINQKYNPPKLKREQAFIYGEETAEILMAAELIEVCDLEEELESHEKLFGIPENIRPHFKEHTMEVVFWGIRNFKMPALPPFPTLLALIDCNGVRLESNTVRCLPSQNFEHHLQRAQIFLPEEEEYIPPITVFLYEFSSQKQANYKGCAILPYLTPFMTQSSKEFPIKFEFEENNKQIIELDEKPDWWTKYYASKRSKRPIRKITIYPSELEKHFDNFQDFLYTFDIKKGKTNLLKPTITQELIAHVKCAIRFNQTENPSKLISSPQNHPMDFTVRVYVVLASHLPQMDINGRCDPYIKLILGKFTYSDRKNYIYKETDPIFGKCFELKGTFPWDHTLKISVMDHDTCFSDELIGETSIDLENRYYTKLHASCGIADTYETVGYCQWRDLFQPSEILARVCRESQMEPPEYLNNAVKIGNSFFDQKQMDKESISLEILKNLQCLMNFGYKLVPEHVETRTLYHPKNPGIDQGKLEMWVDIFPGHVNLPLSVDITPREPQELELRVIVWNTVDVLCEDTSLLTREKSSDIYVKAWLASNDASQQTDIHFRSVTGEGNFNWRFIFPFCYSQAEHTIITWKRVPFSNDLWKEKLPCVFEAQVWDNDLISDDFIGCLSLDLSNMPKGSNSDKKCTLAMLDPDYPHISLFKMKRTRGWWPFKSESKLAGKIDMELEIVNIEEAKKFPAGLGRQGPQPLTEPKRPGTSYLWALNPLKILKNLVFGTVGRKLQIIAGVSAIVTFLLAGWLALPGILLHKLLSTVDEE